MERERQPVRPKRMEKLALLRPPKKMSLYDALEIGYTRDPAKQKKRLKSFGYVYDDELSQGREFVTAHNPYTNKLLRISNGTDFSNLEDVANDLMIGLGDQKNTARFREERNTLLRAKQKYPEDHVVLAAHSLGGQVAHNISGTHSMNKIQMADRVVMYNPAIAPFQKLKPNTQIFRTDGDVVSRFVPASQTVILENPNEQRLNPFANVYEAHNSANIKNIPIFL